jgi:hypothetical protein
MKTKPNLALLSLIFVVIGIVLLVDGIAFLLNPLCVQTNTNQSSQIPVSFAFATTAPLIQDETLFNLDLNSIDANQGTLNATVRLTFQCKEWAKTDLHYNGKTMYFLLQVPSKIDGDNFKVHYDYQNPQFCGGTFSYQNGNGTDKISLITVEIPIENFTYGRLSYLVLNFEMRDAFDRINPFTYHFGIPFSSDLGSYFDKYGSDGLGEITPTSSKDSLVFRYAARASLYLEQPEPNYSISQIMPVPDGIHYNAGNTLYSWDVKALSTPLGSDSVILTIEDSTAKDNMAKLEACAWLFLGLGVPTILSSFLEFIREKQKTANWPFKLFHFKNWAIYCSIVLLCSISAGSLWLYITLTSH